MTELVLTFMRGRVLRLGSIFLPLNANDYGNSYRRHRGDPERATSQENRKPGRSSHNPSNHNSHLYSFTRMSEP